MQSSSQAADVPGEAGQEAWSWAAAAQSAALGAPSCKQKEEKALSLDPDRVHFLQQKCGNQHRCHVCRCSTSHLQLHVCPLRHCSKLLLLCQCSYIVHGLQQQV
jgi:hypothetical protein